MAKVKIVFPQSAGDARCDPMAGYGTRVFVDGVELQDVRSATLHIGLDEVVTLRVEMLVSEGSEIEEVDAKMETVGKC